MLQVIFGEGGRAAGAEPSVGAPQSSSVSDNPPQVQKAQLPSPEAPSEVIEGSSAQSVAKIGHGLLFDEMAGGAAAAGQGAQRRALGMAAWLHKRAAAGKDAAGRRAGDRRQLALQRFAPTQTLGHRIGSGTAAFSACA